MRVLPYFNSIRPTRPGSSLPKVQPQQKPRAREDNSQAVPVSRGEAPGADVFIPSSPVSGVVYSYKTDKAGNSASPDTVIKTGSYSLYQLDGSKQSVETGGVGDKLDLKG